MPLHEDTIAFLAKRNAFRNELAAALRGERTDDEKQEDEDQQVDDCPEDNPEAAAEAAAEEEQGLIDQVIDFFFGPPDPDKEAPGPAAAAVEECKVPPREGTPCNKPDAACDPLRRLDSVEPIECFRDENGWPNSDGLYERIREATVNADDEDNNAFAQIQLMRQANVMESYRKMLLHKKQRLCHYMASWCECLKNEPQSQAEMEQLMLNEPIGRTVTD